MNGDLRKQIFKNSIWQGFLIYDMLGHLKKEEVVQGE